MKIWSQPRADPLLLIFVILICEHPPARLLLALHLALPPFLQLPDPVRGTRQPANLIRNLSTANQRHHNARAHNEGKHETVHTVPGRSPAALGCPRVCVVEEVEDEELRDQSVLGGKEDRGPSCGGCEDANHVAGVALLAAVFGPFKTPVDGTKEGDDLKSSKLANLVFFTGQVAAPVENLRQRRSQSAMAQ